MISISLFYRNITQLYSTQFQTICESLNFKDPWEQNREIISDYNLPSSALQQKIFTGDILLKRDEHGTCFTQMATCNFMGFYAYSMSHKWCLIHP